jgi:phasin family protein
MSKPFTNPFFEADMSKMFDVSKMMNGADMSKMFDLSKMMPGTDLSKMFDVSKIMADYKNPLFDVEAITALQRKNIEAFTAMSQTAYETLQALWRRQTDSYRQALEEASQIAQAIIACPTPEAKALKQAEVSKAALDKYLANLRDASETIAKCNSQAMETVGARLNESLNEVTGIVKNVTSCAA